MLLLDDPFMDRVVADIRRGSSRTTASVDGKIVHNDSRQSEFASLLMEAGRDDEDRLIFYVYETAMRKAGKLKISRDENGNPDFSIFLKEKWDSIYLGVGPRRAVKILRFDDQFFYVTHTINKAGLMLWQWETYTATGSEAAMHNFRDSEELQFTQEDVWRCMAFIFYSDSKSWYVEPASKKETKALGSKPVELTSDIPFKVHRVTQWWNQTLIYGGSHDVAGHMALRACGPGRTKRKITWIRPHKRSNRTVKNTAPKIVSA